MKWFVAATCAAAFGLALTACGGGSRSGDVTVPLRAQQTDIVDAYDILHRLGLRVAVTQQTSITSLVVPIVKLSPHAGAQVPRGSTIKMTPEHGLIGSPAVLKSHPHYRVPDFNGRPLTAAIQWADAHQMFWAIPNLPALPASSEPHLFDAYRIVGQQPRSGGTIVQGVMVGKGFRPTPLTLTVVLR